MDEQEIRKIIEVVTEELQKNFDKYKYDDYGIASKTLVPFATIESKSRVVRSEGTDEDEDIMICYDEKGWMIWYSTVQVGAGVQKVIEDHEQRINPEGVVNKFNELTTYEKMVFMVEAYRIISFAENKYKLFK